MAKRRSYKKRNEREINAFLSDIITPTMMGTRNAMLTIAQRGINRLVNNVASFSDYTGVLVNSYQAAIISKGKFNFKGRGPGGDFDAIGQTRRPYRVQGKNQFKNASGGTVLMTSYGVEGATDVSFWTEGRHGQSIARRKQRKNKRTKASIRNYWKKRTKEYQGYGLKTTNIRSYVPSIKWGYEVVFDNPAPYAQFVQEHNDGSVVMPMGVANIMNRGLALSITTNEIIKAHKRKKRR